MPRFRAHAVSAGASVAQFLPYIAAITTLLSLSLLSGCGTGADADAQAAAPAD